MAMKCGLGLGALSSPARRYKRQFWDTKQWGIFITHRGWNSTLESLAADIPMIMLSLQLDQPNNSLLLVAEEKVVVELNMSDGVAKRE